MTKKIAYSPCSSVRGPWIPEGTTSFTWSLVWNRQRRFHHQLAPANCSSPARPNYERPADSGGNNVYNVTVRASDGSLTGTKDITVTVN